MKNSKSGNRDNSLVLKLGVTHAARESLAGRCSPFQSPLFSYVSVAPVLGNKIQPWLPTNLSLVGSACCVLKTCRYIEDPLETFSKHFVLIGMYGHIWAGKGGVSEATPRGGGFKQEFHKPCLLRSGQDREFQ